MALGVQQELRGPIPEEHLLTLRCLLPFRLCVSREERIEELMKTRFGGFRRVGKF